MARITSEDEKEKEKKKEAELLGKDPLIYQKNHDFVQKGVFKNLSGKDKWTYFKDYYLAKLVVLILIVACVSVFLYTILRPRPEKVLYTVIENCHPDYDEYFKFKEGFINRFSLDEDDYEISFDDNYHSATDAYSDQRLSAYLFNEMIDMYIGSKSDFTDFALNANCYDLRELLPEQTFNALKDRFIYFHDDATNEEVPLGISLTDNKYYDKIDLRVEEPYIGVVHTTKHKEYAIAMIEYLFDLDITVTIPVPEEEK